MKSSIDFLIDQLSHYLCFPLGESAGYNLQDVFNRAKEIHKDEIIDAYFEGAKGWFEEYRGDVADYDKEEAEQYYNETFNNKYK